MRGGGVLLLLGVAVTPQSPSPYLLYYDGPSLHPPDTRTAPQSYETFTSYARVMYGRGGFLDVLRLLT